MILLRYRLFILILFTLFAFLPFITRNPHVISRRTAFHDCDTYLTFDLPLTDHVVEPCPATHSFYDDHTF